MDTEHMRRVLAERALELHEIEVEVNPNAHMMYWADASGKLVVRVDYWTPEEDWECCGMVIEAMREKGWEFKLAWDDTMAVAAFQKEWGLYHAIVEGANSAGICYVVSVAATRALEATDEVS